MRIQIKIEDILDIIFILSYSIGYVSLVKYVTYAIFPIPESLGLFLYLVLIYFIRFGSNPAPCKGIKGNLLKFILLFYIWEVIQGLIVGSDINGILVVLLNLASTLVAYRYLNNILQSPHGIERIIDTYSAYMYYTVFVVIFSSILILSSVMSPYTNAMDSNSLMYDNMERNGGSYYFPGFLSVVYPTPSILLFRFNFPSLSGLSHESQAMYFTIYPALFLMFSKGVSLKTEKRVIAIFLLTTVITTSLTAVICFLLTYSFHLLWKLKDTKQRASAILICSFILILVSYLAYSQFNQIFRSFYLEKANFDSAGSSGSYSLNLLIYIISPSGFLGQGIFSSTLEQALVGSMNCGYISSCGIIVLYCMFIRTCIKNIFANNLLSHSIGLASLYFITHSFKYGIQVFNSCYIFFIIFLLTYADVERRKWKNRAFQKQINNKIQKL